MDNSIQFKLSTTLNQSQSWATFHPMFEMKHTKYLNKAHQTLDLKIPKIKCVQCLKNIRTVFI